MLTLLALGKTSVPLSGQVEAMPFQVLAEMIPFQGDLDDLLAERLGLPL
jgi:hypothetical protein